MMMAVRVIDDIPIFSMIRIFALLSLIITVNSTGILLTGHIGTDWLNINKNTTSLSQFLPSLVDLYGHISSFYDYFMTICKSNQYNYQEFELEGAAKLMERVGKRLHTSGDYAGLVQSAVDLAFKYQSVDHISHWEYFGHDGDIIVWKLKKPVMNDSEGAKWPCIKSHTTIDMPVEKLVKLLMDSNKVTLLNKYSAGRIDVEMLGEGSKIVWNKTKIPFSVKPYDFCTLMHAVHDTDTRCTMILSKAADHKKVPIHKDFSRSEIIFGLNILRPCATDSSKTDFTSINHVRYHGIPSFFAWRSGYGGTVSYLKQLKEVAVSMS
jgi:hypothetical protein